METNLMKTYEKIFGIAPPEMLRDYMRIAESIMHELRQQESKFIIGHLVYAMQKHEPLCTEENIISYLPYVHREIHPHQTVFKYVKSSGTGFVHVPLFVIKQSLQFNTEVSFERVSRSFMTIIIEHNEP